MGRITKAWEKMMEDKFNELRQEIYLFYREKYNGPITATDPKVDPVRSRLEDLFGACISHFCSAPTKRAKEKYYDSVMNEFRTIKENEGK